MALVDYSSSESAGEDSGSDARQIKRRKADDGKAAHPSRSPDTADGAPSNSATGAGTLAQARGAGASSMPPLPDTFHDLYASTVRQSVVDDPSLHQGRKRQIPHVVGNWPSHVYTEWHPSTTQHAVLTDLLSDIEEQLSGEAELRNFLTSDLGSPLPLHISLSRPLSLTTGNKDDFLDKVTQSFDCSGIAPFVVRPQGLAWYRSPDSDRTFLILRVASSTSKATADAQDAAKHLNPELMALLMRTNTLVTQFGQPTLYQRNTKEAVDTAFHISIGWTFDLPGDDASIRILRLFKEAKFAGIRDWEISITAIKAKIGNVVNHIDLKRAGRGGASSSGPTSFLGP
ncbi:hypothetical protein ACJZ2D_013876 [Fusarium nematophilum]